MYLPTNYRTTNLTSLNVNHSFATYVNTISYILATLQIIPHKRCVSPADAFWNRTTSQIGNTQNLSNLTNTLTKAVLACPPQSTRKMQYFTLSGHIISRLMTDVRRPAACAMDPLGPAHSKFLTRSTLTALTRPAQDFSMQFPRQRTGWNHPNFWRTLRKNGHHYHIWCSVDAISKLP